jgi:hypothetical protein
MQDAIMRCILAVGACVALYIVMSDLVRAAGF